MPMFIASALVAAGASATVAAIASYAIVIGGSLLMSQRAKKKAARQAREQYNAAQVDRLANVDSAVAPRRLVLGRARVGGSPFFRAAAGEFNRHFLMTIELAGHEIDEVEQIYFNDQPVTLDSEGRVASAPYARDSAQSYTEVATAEVFALHFAPIAGSVSASRVIGDQQVQVPCSISGSTVTLAAADVGATIDYQYLATGTHAWVSWHYGTENQAADAGLLSWFPGKWTAAHRARGVAYLVCEFLYEETAFPNGLPAVTALVRGAKVYDPRSGQTAWSENPALLLRHVYTHPYFGNKVASADVDARIAAAANACDMSAAYVVDGVTTNRPTYTAGLVVPFGTAARDAMDDLAQAMAGMWAYGRGDLFVRAGAYSAPVMTLTDADLAVEVRDNGSLQAEQQALSVSVHRARNDKFNVANVRIWDSGQDYKEAALTPLKAGALIARDGGELPREISMQAVGYAPQALHIAGVTMRDERDALTLSAAFNLRAYALEVGDTVAVTMARYGWVAKEFIVLERTWTLEGLIRLTLKETSAAIYALDAEFDPQGYGQNTDLPEPWRVDPPAALQLASGTDQLVVLAGAVVARVRVAWPAIENPAVTDGGQVEIQYRTVAETTWRSVQVPGSSTEAFLPDVAEGQILLVRARSRTRLALSDWGLQVAHDVVGQTERPTPPGSFSVLANAGLALVSWALHPAPDVRYGGQLVVRHTPKLTGAAWEDGCVLEVFDGNSTTGTVALITGTYMVKAVDASGNWSEVPALFVATEGMVTGYATVATSTQETDFAGVKTNVTAIDGLLKLDSSVTVDSMTDPIDSWGPIDALGGIAASGTYLFDAGLDHGSVAVRRYEVDLRMFAYDTANLIDSRTDAIDSWASIDGDEINDCDVTVFARTTNDDPAGTPAWSAWTPFMVADFNCRALEFRADLTSGFPTHTLQVEQLRVHAKTPI